MSLTVALGAALLAAMLPVGEVETVTITDTGFTVTFVTKAPASPEIRYGESPGRQDKTTESTGPPTRYHCLRVEGLRPGTKYYYRIISGKSQWPPSPLPPESVTTLTPPPGEYLFSFAVINDVHAMEDIAGLMVPPVSWLPPFTPGFTWRYPVVNYWEFTLRDAVSEINKTDAGLCVINGDLTSWFTEEEFQKVKSYLDRLDMPYYVTRGNHDRVEDYPEDYFLKTFGLESSWYSVDHKGFHFVFLDDNRLADGWMDIPDPEFDWLEKDLEANRDKPTFIFEHRPAAAGGVDVNKADRERLLSIMAAHPGLVGVFNAHSHAAKVITAPGFTGDVLHVQVPAVKEYPVGYGMLKVYEGGFMYNFHPLDCADCLEWNNITRGQYFGMAPRLNGGRVSDRNLVHVFEPVVRKMIMSR
jgi:3',5'-cyclic AMP phosphodiesterase CpdA